MSATGALIAALITILLLGAFAAWLMNVPLWLIAVGTIVGGWIVSRLAKRFSRGRARQEPERSP